VHAGYLKPQTLGIFKNYLSSTATMVARTHLQITLQVHCLSCAVVLRTYMKQTAFFDERPCVLVYTSRLLGEKYCRCFRRKSVERKRESVFPHKLHIFIFGNEEA